MKMHMPSLPFKKVSIGIVAILVMAISLGLPAFAPFLTGVAHAEAPTRVDMVYGGSASTPDRSEITSCVGRMKIAAMNEETIKAALLDETALAEFTQDSYTIAGKDVQASVINRYGSFIGTNTGKDVNVIVLEAAPNLSSEATKECSGGPGGGRYILLPVESKAGTADKNPDNPKVWVGAQTEFRVGVAGRGFNLIRFTAYDNLTADGLSTPGRLEFLHRGNNPSRTQENVVIEGVAKPAAPVTVGSVQSAKFLDASRIEVTNRVGGTDFKEVYIDPKWDGRQYYFLASSTEPTRGQRTFTAKGGDANDTPLTQDNNKGIPFIHLEGPGINLNLTSGRTTADFQNGIMGIGNVVKFYDFTTAGSPVNPDPNNSTRPQAQDISGKTDKARAHVWFYYSASAKSFATAFGSGDGNETHYAGTYTQSPGNPEFVHAGANCPSLGSLTPSVIPGAGQVATATWALKSPTSSACTAAPGFGTVTVDVVGDDGMFDQSTGAQPSNSTLPTSGRLPRIVCDVSILNPITWLFCPIATAATSAAAQLDEAILDVLNVNGDQYFGNTDTGNKLYAAWSNMRIIAMGLLVLFAFFMVISQILGWQAITAYMFKKAMPNFLLAIFLLVLWWPIGRFIIQAGDVATFGIRQVILAPFGGAGAIHIGNDGTGAALTLLGGAGILALGIFAVATFAISAFVAALVGYAILMARVGVVVAGMVASPFYIPFKAFPGGERIFSFGMGGFLKAVWLGPILSGAIALAHALAWILHAAGGGKLTFTIMALVAWFGIYFALWTIVSAVGGAAALLAGKVKSYGDGVLGGLRQYRGQQPGNRWKAFKHGELMKNSLVFDKRRGGLGNVGRFIDRAGTRVGLGAGNRFGFGNVGRAAEMLHLDSGTDKYLQENPDLLSLGRNHDLANMIFANSGDGSFRGINAAISDYNDQQRANGQAEMTEAERAQVMALVTPFMRGGRRAVMAARSNLFQNKARAVAAGNVSILQRGAERLSEGDAVFAQQQISRDAWAARSGGRTDLGGEVNHNPQTDSWITAFEASGMDRNQAVSMAAALDGMGRTSATDVLRGHPRGVEGTMNAISYILSDRFSHDAVDGNGNNVGNDLKRMAAEYALALQRNKAAANPDALRALNNRFQRAVSEGGLGINYQVGDRTMAQQLAARANHGSAVPITDDRALSLAAPIYDSTDQTPLSARNQP